MSTPAPASPYQPSRSDRSGIWAFIFVGAALVIATAVVSIQRIIEILKPDPTPVEIAFDGAAASIPYATGGELDIAVGSGVLHATDLPVFSVIAGVAAPIALVAVTAAIAVCTILVATAVLKGQIFSRRNSRLVAAALFTGIIGFPFVKLCETMLANGAIARATGGQLDNLVMSFSPLPYMFVAFMGALIATVFVVGERMQRDTEGLV